MGVDIGDDEVRLVKVRHLLGGQWELLNCKRAFIEPGIVPGTPEYVAFLRSEIEEFCSSRKNCNVWALFRSDTLDVQNIRIPNVSKKQLENAVYWTAKKETSFDETKTILDFEVQGEVIEEGITKLSVIICIASKHEVADMERLFEEIGVPLTGLTAAPFALQNIFRADWMPLPDRTATLYIGDESSRIDVFSRGNLMMTRDIRAGINSMADSLLEEYVASVAPKEQPVIFPEDGADSEPVSSLMNVQDARDLVFSMGFDSPPPYGNTGRFGLDKDEIFEMIRPALERLVRQVERTLEHYTVILGNEGVDFIYVFSDAGVYHPVIDYIGGQLRVNSGILDPLSPGNPLCRKVTEHTFASQRASLTSALGLALSNLSRTLNLICTHGDKEKIAQTKRVNRAIFSVFAVGLLVLVGLFFWMGHVVERKEETLAQLNRQMRSDMGAIQENARIMVSEINDNRLTLKQFRERYWGVAVIGELSRLTPEGVYLSTVRATGGKDSGSQTRTESGGVTISGVVTGGNDSLDAALARYVVALKRSPIFEQVAIDTGARKPFQAKDALHFTITVSFTGA